MRGSYSRCRRFESCSRYQLRKSMKFEGNYWHFIIHDINCKPVLLAPGMIRIQEAEFNHDVNGLKANYMDNALFKTKNEAVEYMIAHLEQMKDG